MDSASSWLPGEEKITVGYRHIIAPLTNQRKQPVPPSADCSTPPGPNQVGYIWSHVTVLTNQREQPVPPSADCSTPPGPNQVGYIWSRVAVLTNQREQPNQVSTLGHVLLC